jgi:hypothetical protein
MRPVLRLPSGASRRHPADGYDAPQPVSPATGEGGAAAALECGGLAAALPLSAPPQRELAPAPRPAHLAGCSGAGAGPQALHPHPNPPPRGEGTAAARGYSLPPRGRAGWGFARPRAVTARRMGTPGPPPGDVLRFPRGGGKPPGGGRTRRKARASPRTPKLPRWVSQADRLVRACVSGATIVRSWIATYAESGPRPCLP